jgi:hypothetical protein
VWIAAFEHRLQTPIIRNRVLRVFMRGAACSWKVGGATTIAATGRP